MGFVRTPGPPAEIWAQLPGHGVGPERLEHSGGGRRNASEVQVAGTPRPGDYWLIPARSFNHDVEWPQGELPPHGIGRHYSRLALVELNDGQFSRREDCRFLFSSLTDLRALTAVRSALNAPDGTIYVDEAGNVGIGTREPSGRLEVRGDIVVREGAPSL